MITVHFQVAFTYHVENTQFSVPMTADVEAYHSQTHYVITNLCATSKPRIAILPDIVILKKDGQWVHKDSEQDSYLSVHVGQAIDAFQKKHDLSGSPPTGPDVS